MYFIIHDKIHITYGTLTIALPCGYIEICEVSQAADKTLNQRLLYVLSPTPNPSRLRMFDNAKVIKKMI